MKLASGITNSSALLVAAKIVHRAYARAAISASEAPDCGSAGLQSGRPPNDPRSYVYEGSRVPAGLPPRRGFGTRRSPLALACPCGTLGCQSCPRLLPGDFVECGVSSGFLSSAIMTAIDWNALDRTFYLLDTFRGIDERYVSEAEKDNGIMRHSARNITSGLYAVDVDAVRQNFSEWHRTRIIVGSVPETLAQVDAQRIAFLHLDLNCAIPEARALNHFWDRLTPGALVLMDDYAYHGASVQKALLDEVAHSKGVSIVALPTGQGLLIKPPDAGRKNLVIDRQDGAPH